MYAIRCFDFPKFYSSDEPFRACSTVFHDQDNFDTSIHNCQRDFDVLNDTSQSWGLVMNAGKCVVMRFTPRNCSLQYSGVSPYTIGSAHLNFVESHSDLGITIDRSLRFHAHIRRIYKNSWSHNDKFT